jgi:hypothetical protein
MKIAIVVLLGVHGLIHAMGFVGTWGLAQFEGASQTPTNLITLGPDEPLVRLFAIVWLAALAGFLAAAFLLLTGSGSWRLVAVVAVAVSMVPVVLWWQNAPLGAVANALVLLAVFLAPKLEGVPA